MKKFFTLSLRYTFLRVFVVFSLACAVLLSAATTAWAGKDGYLIVADPVAEKLYVYHLPTLELAAEFEGLRLGTHAGFLPLKGDRVLFVHEENLEEGEGELIVLKLNLRGQPAIIGRAPVGAPASHIAVHPKMTYTVAGSDDEERKLSIVDLRPLSSTAYDTLAFVSIDSLDPGVAIGGTPPVVYHRFINEDFTAGRLEAFPLANLLAGDFTPTGQVSLETPPHGEVISHKLKRFCSAIVEGFACTDIVGDSLLPGGLLPYDTAERSGGQAFFARLADDQRFLYSYLRDSTTGDTWPEAQNDAYIADLQSNQVTRLPLGPGWLFRFALSKRFALYNIVHPDGNAAHLLDTNPRSAAFLQVVATIPLDPPSIPLDPNIPAFQQGHAARRTAITPDGRWGFVSHGGEGVISVIDTAAEQVTRKLEIPTSLEGGGYLVAVQPRMKLGDTIGR